MFLIKYAVAAVLPAAPAAPVKRERPKVEVVKTQDEDDPKVYRITRRTGPVVTYKPEYFVKDEDGNFIPLEDSLRIIEEEEDDDWFVGESAPQSRPIPIRGPRAAKGWGDGSW